MGTILSTARRAGRICGPVLVALSVLWFGFLGIGPHTGRYRTLTVLTGSMRPAIAPGSLVVVTPKALEDVRVGDVVTYTAPVGGRPTVTHRVVDVRPAGPGRVIQTQGDANAAPDPWLAQLDEGPVWTVRGVVPHAGRAVQALRSPLVRQATVWGAPLALALLWLGQIWRPARAGAPTPPARPVRPSRPPRPGLVALGLAVGIVGVGLARRRRGAHGLAA